MITIERNAFAGFAQMTDIETLGTRCGCSILVIGAMAFDPFSQWQQDGQEVARDNRFKVAIDRASNLKYGLVEDPKTVKFWDDQPEEAREEAFSGTVDLKEALIMYREWLLDTFGANERNQINVTSYCHGATFDVPIIEWTMTELGIESPFPYNGTRDTRGLFELAGIYYKGAAHRVWKDCEAQCAAVCRSHSILGFSREQGRLPGWMIEHEGKTINFVNR